MIRTALALALATIAGCVPSQSSARHPVDAELARRLGDPQLVVAPERDPDAADAALTARLAQPLDREAAVRIALARAPRLRAVLEQLGVARGALDLALGPLEIEVEAMFAHGGADYEASVIQDLVGLVTAWHRRAAGREELAAAQATVAAAAIRLAGRVEQAFHDLLAAQQALELRRTAYDAADAAAVVRERMHTAGNTSELARARDRAAREQARIDLSRAETAIETRREAINALLGLTGAHTRWTAAGRLPELPAAPPALDGLEATAVAASLELAAGRARTASAANRVAEQRLRTVLPHLGVGVAIHRDHHTATDVGPALSIGLPLLDWNTGGRARANAEHRRAGHELTAAAIELRAAARSARLEALAAHQEARHLRDIVLPLRQQIVDETLKHYNAMDADPFALIVARRELVDAGQQYLDALRRYANASAAVRALERGVALDPPSELAPTAGASPSPERSH